MQLPTRQPNESAHDFAFRALRHNIVNLHFLPGAFISCHDLAGQMGVSRTPLREAMQQLHRIGLLTVHANAGSRISLIDHSRINELRLIRRTMESIAAETVCGRIGPEDLFAFEEMIMKQSNRLKRSRTGQCPGEAMLRRGSGDVQTARPSSNFIVPSPLMELDDEFHAHLYRLAGMTATYDIISPFHCHLDRFHRLFHTSGHEARIVAEHAELFNAFKNRDKKTAKKIVMIHFSGDLKTELETIDNYSEYFTNIDDTGRDHRWMPPPAAFS